LAADLDSLEAMISTGWTLMGGQKAPDRGYHLTNFRAVEELGNLC
jgi:hypothetical protein